jgi:hypothetical protein
MADAPHATTSAIDGQFNAAIARNDQTIAIATKYGAIHGISWWFQADTSAYSASAGDGA